MDHPQSAREELESMGKDELDFLEREIFHAYDREYESYEKHDADNLEELALYERALETVSKIRRFREQVEEDRLRQAKDIQDLLD